METRIFNHNNLLNQFFDKLKTDKFNEVLDTALQLNREVYIGSIDAVVADNVEAVIRFWNLVDESAETPVEERTPIKLYINSPGGELQATFSIIDAITMSKTPVYTINVGEACSGGFFVAIAGHARFTYPHSHFMYHEGSVGMGGDAHKFRNAADFYKKQLNQLKNHTLHYTNLTEEDYERILKDDYWLTAEEALAIGVCDEILTDFCYE